MSIPIYHIDAFSTELFGGNPAAVVILSDWFSEIKMQQIAAENNLSETAFVLQNQDKFEIRWFTPLTEVDLCGHATLAAAHVLFAHEGYIGDEINFMSKSGNLRVFKDGDKLFLDFPVDEIEHILEFPQLIKFDRSYLIKEIYKGATDYMFVLENEDHVRDFAPPYGKMSTLDCRGVIITAPSKNGIDFVSRFFAPQSGINEDPVTGSAHTTLVPFWAKRLGKSKLKAAQLSTRGGVLDCEFLNTRVYIGGKCISYLKGELYI